ncbi:NAD(P)H-binding protein [Actinophytocola sp. NPDC049390]|uniref:NAD(P)H-binding protein n=1 Tax=Actinophytocola sp. NPDC049390 TaxID=3363894 RepID=UPI0037A1CD34
MNEYTVTVFGATGKTGRHVARYAAERGWRVRAAGRRPSAGHGSGEFEPFDWDDERTWTTASRGSDAAYVLIPFNHAGAPERTPALLEAVAAAGVARIVLLSSLDVTEAEPDSPLRLAESTLDGLGAATAALRPTWFLDNFTHGSFSGMVDAGELRLPAGEGRIPFVDARDVAAVGVAAMAPDGPTGPLPITGPAALTHHDVAAALTAAGRPVRYTPVSAAEFVDLMTGRGFSADYGAFLAAALDRVATGELVIPVTDTVLRETGHPARTAEDFAQDNTP